MFFIWRINLTSCRGRRQNNIFFTRKFLLFFMVETKSPTSCRRSICPRKDAITCKKFLNKFVEILSTRINIKNKKDYFLKKTQRAWLFFSALFKNNGRLLSSFNNSLMAHIFFTFLRFFCTIIKNSPDSSFQRKCCSKVIK